VCVVGAGIAGLSAAIESARLSRDVVLVGSLPLIGGQMVHSLIGLFCGVFGNGPRYAQLTHGIFDDIFRDLAPAGNLHFQRGHTMTVYYNEVVLGRWLEQTVRGLGVRTVLGTVLQRVDIDGGRINAIELASRYGNVTVKAAVMHNIYVLGSMQDWLAAAPKGTSAEAKQTAAGLQASFAGMKSAGYTSANELDNSQPGWDAGLEINWAVTSAGTLDETTVMHKLQHLDINTLGIVWARSPANYENISQVLAAMEVIAPDGTVTLYNG
jgi:phytoene dehydrogenase-like protein